MLDVVRPAAHRRALAAAFDVEILSLATANPPFRLPQSEAAVYAKQLYPQLSKLWQLYDNTGIECRYNCEPIEWYLRPHSWEERTESFRRHALDLLEEVTIKATERAGIALNDVDMIVTNTITGLAIPSLDAMLLNRLKLAPTIERLPMFGLGSGAGAAGLLLHNTRNDSRAGPRILASGEWCWGNTEHIMGWDIKDDGFGIVLSPELPSLMKKALAPAFNDFFERNGLALSDFNGFLFHPGGRKLLETMEEVLGLTRDQLSHSWEVLRRYGNMSSATALFVLARAIQSGACGPHLVAAFGPGFSAYFAAVEL